MELLRDGRNALASQAFRGPAHRFTTALFWTCRLLPVVVMVLLRRTLE